VTFRRRSYPEVLETLLTSLSGGVAAEPHPFPPDGGATPPIRMPLLQAHVTDLVAVHGTRNGRSHRFRKGTDFVLAPDGQTLVWPEGADLPDPGTTVQISYYGERRTGPVTDIETGSVVRTLAESFALEVAGLYAQLEAVYTSAFIDTASGRALDNVVALLGLERVAGGRAVTSIELARAPGSRGVINIPAGTRVIDPAGDVEYEITEDVVLAPDQKTIRARARDLEPNDPVPADTLTVLPVPIAGIAAVSNPAPAAIVTADETDAELRARARSFLHGSERATLGALRHAIAWQGGGITADIEEDAAQPGRVRIRPHADSLPPVLEQRLRAAIEEARPAGVLVEMLEEVPPRRVDLSLRLTTSDTLLEQELRAVQDAVRSRVAAYFHKLPVREDGSLNRLVGQVMGVDGVLDVRITGAAVADDDVLDRDAGLFRLGGMPTVLGELSVADPHLATQLLVLVAHPAGEAIPDTAAIRTELAGAIAYLNERNAAERNGDPGEAARHVLSYGKLLRVLPLPGKPAASLQAFDDEVAGGGSPTLPDATSVLPYRASFVLRQAAGLSLRLSEAGQTYELTPFERLALASVVLEQEA
jgi:uncharacterized phage protein gp47/JayE